MSQYRDNFCLKGSALLFAYEKYKARPTKDIDFLGDNYIRRYADVSRFDARNYDMVLSTDGHTEEQIADIILSYIG